MREKIRLEIISVLEESIKDIKKNDLASLREQSEKIINISAIYQDKATISLAVILYSIFKILEKKRYTTYKDWNKFKINLIKNLRSALDSLKKGDIEIYYHFIKQVIRDLKQIEDEMGLFIDHVLNTTKIKKACSLFLNGLSLGRVAEILGIPKWDLMKYFAQARESTESPFTISKSVIERLNYTKKIFNLR
jgi:hypothetical protein